MSIAKRPQLIIIAGPNGAGKSTISFRFTEKNTILYDPDKESKQIFDKYPHLPAESIYYFINHHFQDKIEKAVKGKKDFVLESNFRDYQIMDTVEQFKNKGYQTNLMYFLLKSEEASKDRVTERVNDGGHFVDTDSIVLNYKEGLANLHYFAPRFDRLLLFDASERVGELVPLLNIDSNKIKYLHDEIPAWAESTIQQLMTTMSSNRQTGEKQRSRQRFKPIANYDQIHKLSTTNK